MDNRALTLLLEKVRSWNMFKGKAESCLRKTIKFCISTVLCLFIYGLPVASAGGVDRLVEELRKPGRYMFMRHALAPGTGDPDHFDLNDCSTQRNLNDQGRRQAREFGKKLKQLGLKFDKIYTSQWCRCKETAELLDLGEVEELPALNSVWLRSEKDQQASHEKMRNFMENIPSEKNILFVTHWANISIFTSASVGSGESVVVHLQDSQFAVIGEFPNE